MKTNIVLIGFFKEFTKQIGKKLALDFGLYYADVEEMIEYNLMNEKEIEELCGVDYLNNLKNKIIKDLSCYENTLITIPYNMFITNKNYDMFKSYCTIVFLNFSRDFIKEEINKSQDKTIKNDGNVFLLAYEERTKFCIDNSDISINITQSDLDNSYKKIKKCLDKYYL